MEQYYVTFILNKITKMSPNVMCGFECLVGPEVCV